MPPLKQFVVTLQMPVGIERGIIEAETLVDAEIYTAQEYPHTTVLSIYEVPTNKLWNS